MLFYASTGAFPFSNPLSWGNSWLPLATRQPFSTALADMTEMYPKSGFPENNLFHLFCFVISFAPTGFAFISNKTKFSFSFYRYEHMYFSPPDSWLKCQFVRLGDIFPRWNVNFCKFRSLVHCWMLCRLWLNKYRLVDLVQSRHWFLVWESKHGIISWLIIINKKLTASKGPLWMQEYGNSLHKLLQLTFVGAVKTASSEHQHIKIHSYQLFSHSRTYTH